jgi:hypothetical protein
MHFRFLIFFIIPFISFLAEDPDSSLIAYYSFDNCDARDDSGFGSDGKMYGYPECWCGVKDDGLLFDGKDDYLVFEGIVNRYFSTSDLTVSFFIRPEVSMPFKRQLLSKRDSCNQGPQLDFQFNGSFQRVDIECRENEYNYFSGLSADSDAQMWQHIVLVRKGIYAYTFINGTLRQKSRKCRGVDISNDAFLRFSDSPCMGEGLRRFKGVLDELKIFDRAFSEEEVLRLFRSVPLEQANQDCFS